MSGAREEWKPYVRWATIDPDRLSQEAKEKGKRIIEAALQGIGRPEGGLTVTVYQEDTRPDGERWSIRAHTSGGGTFSTRDYASAVRDALVSSGILGPNVILDPV